MVTVDALAVVVESLNPVELDVVAVTEGDIFEDNVAGVEIFVVVVAGVDIFAVIVAEVDICAVVVAGVAVVVDVDVELITGKTHVPQQSIVLTVLLYMLQDVMIHPVM